MLGVSPSSPDGRSLASGSWDNSIKLWDIASQHKSPRLWGILTLFSVAFFPRWSQLSQWQ
ncbi:MAG: hypothetical protein R2880_15515 [Deinococcales bacterium]